MFTLGPSSRSEYQQFVVSIVFGILVYIVCLTLFTFPAVAIDTAIESCYTLSESDDPTALVDCESQFHTAKNIIFFMPMINSFITTALVIFCFYYKQKLET